MRNFIIIMATLIFAALVVFWVITGLQIMAVAFFIFAGVTSLISTSKLFQWAENRHKHTWVTLTTAVVEEIDIDKEQGACIGIDFDTKQETENLTKRIKFFVDEFNNGDNRYYFYDSCTGHINKMDIGGLLEFHMCCDFIE